MTVRLKILLAVSAVFAALLALLSLVFYRFQMKEFTAMEVRETISKMANVGAMARQELEQLQGTTMDWASWDDTYRFAQDRYPEFIEANGISETFTNNRVTLMVVADQKGQILFGMGYDLERDVSYPLQSGVTRGLNEFLNRFKGTEKKGFIRLGEDGPVMLVARPILNSRGEGPPRGTFIFARRIDGTKIHSWGGVAQVDLKAVQWDEVRMSDEIKAVLGDLVSRGGVVVRPLSGEVVAGYAHLTDFDGKPVLVLKVSLPRDIYQQGVRSVYSLIISMILVGFVFSAAIMLMLHRVVLLPLGKLSRYVGSVKAADASVRPLALSGNDEFHRLAGEMARMLSDLHASREELMASERKYRSLFEESKDCVFITAADGQVLDMNPAGIELFGYDSLQEMIKVNFTRQLCTDHNKCEQVMDRLRRAGYVKDFEMPLVGRNGKPIISLLTASAVKDHAGNVTAVRGFLHDVTEQWQLRQQLQQAQKMEAIGTLAGGIAHDFNNLLSGILGYTSLMMEQVDKDKTLTEYLETIERSATRAAELTDQLLAFARKGKYDVRPIDLNEVVDEAYQIIVHTFDKAIEIRQNLQPGLRKIEGDRTRVLQMVINLCVNARDAMPDGGVLSLSTESFIVGKDFIDKTPYAREGDYVLLTVRDNGLGMDQETMKKIFDPFFTTKAEGKGTGLGLAMAYGTVKGHDGFITVESAPRAGSTFRVYLPAVTREVPPEPLSEPAPRPPTREEAAILVVDDEATIRSMVKIMLEREGYRVFLAADGEEAVSLYRENLGRVDLVIIDMVMPHMGGQETFTKLKELDPKVKAILSTGYSHEGKAQEIMRNGVIGFIKKPFRVRELVAKVAKALADHHGTG